MPVHKLLAKMGKNLLRPGGRQLTEWLIKELHISAADDIVELAPGSGSSARLIDQYHPLSYIGIDTDTEVIALLQARFRRKNMRFVQANAAHTALQANSKDLVFSEALLTMQNAGQKKAIIQEVHRILKPGGLYAVHELVFVSHDAEMPIEEALRRQLSKTARVHARPLSSAAWQQLLQNNGFHIINTIQVPMQLLEPKRILNDEGIAGSLKILFHILRHPEAWQRLRHLRSLLRRYNKHLNAIAIIAKKI